MKEVTVYVFDHSGGFDWYYKLSNARREISLYRNAGWITDDDSLWSVPIPGMIGDKSVRDQEHATDYLETEAYLDMPGSVQLTL